MNVRSLNLRAALDRLSLSFAEHPRSIVAFDADGTLWSDDVGCLVFEYALREGLLHERAAEALGLICIRIDPEGALPDGATARARLLLRHYEDGRISDKEMAEVQVWAYAGLTEREAERLAGAALAERPRDAVRKELVFSLVQESRARGARVVIVSASPEWVVALAAVELGFESAHVIGGRAVVKNSVIEPMLDGELPYGEGKVNHLRARFGGDPLVLATGDSGFDLHLLGAAQLGLGVGKKPRLLAGIAELSHCFLLEEA